MSSSDEQKGAKAPDSRPPSAEGQVPDQHAPVEPSVPSSSESSPPDLPNEDPYSSTYDSYGDYKPAVEETVPATVSAPAGGGGTPPVEPPPDEPEEEDDGMLRMSFLGHLEELRSRILKALAGVGVAFVVCLVFADWLWLKVSAPAVSALRTLGFEDKLAQITPMDAFTTIWVKLPLLAAVFVASPWLLYQVWAFIAPGLYKKERKWATPFVLSAAGLFLTGGLFAYFVIFPFGLTFLLGIGKDINVKPVINLTDYFDLFVNVMLGVGLVFEMPVVIFFLTLLRLASPGFLLRNSRYAILIITIIAAIVTPTPDIFNLMLFAVPMCLLYFVGIFAGYLLVLHREEKKFPWSKLFIVLLVIAAIIAVVASIMVWKFGYHTLNHWPFLTR
jgi:sec-independent protein translocase protein TatC